MDTHVVEDVVPRHPKSSRGGTARGFYKDGCDSLRCLTVPVTRGMPEPLRLNPLAGTTGKQESRRTVCCAGCPSPSLPAGLPIREQQTTAFSDPLWTRNLLSSGARRLTVQSTSCGEPAVVAAKPGAAEPTVPFRGLTRPNPTIRILVVDFNRPLLKQGSGDEFCVGPSKRQPSGEGPKGLTT